MSEHTTGQEQEQMNNTHTFKPGDKVRVKMWGGMTAAPSTVTVTYPGQTGIPGRVYVKGVGGTFHHHPSELVREEDVK